MELLPQSKEFKYLRVLFTSEGKKEREVDRRIRAASAGLLRCGGEEGAEEEGKALDFPFIYALTLTYGHELWVVTERTRYKWLK